MPAAYSGTSVNYVRVWEPNMPTSDTNVVLSAARTIAEVKQATKYFDGMGRPLQSVIKGTSPGGKDIVTPVVYDSLGREQYKYLPYAQQTGNSSDGKFKTDPFNSQKIYYQNASLNPNVAGETVYYSAVTYEASPLNRVLKVYAPGNSWAKEGGNHPTENQYQINTLADSVRIWSMGTDLPVSNNIYAAGKLYKNITLDESGSKAIEYTDLLGRIVLKKSQLSAAPGTGHIGWLCTYYVYDNLSNLRVVIPPLATEISMRLAWNLSTVANELCFQYKYDSRNRLMAKKIPGAGVVYLIYDVRDRLVFTQDSIQRTKNPQEWFTTFYDDLNRPTMTAIYKANTTPSSLQASLNTAVSGTQSISYTYPGIANLILGNYNGDSSYTATQSIEFQTEFDTGSGATVTASINSAVTGGTTNLMVTNPLPSIAASDLTPLAYTFYDDYSYAGALSYQTADLGKPDAGVGSYPVALPTAFNARIKGMVTGTKVRILDSDQWLTSTIYYDGLNRNIQVSSENSVGGKDIVTNLYDFEGKLLSRYLRHTNPRSIGIPQVSVLTMLAYDATGRLLTVKKRLNDVTGQDKTTVANTYDELGRLKQKRLGVTGTNTQLDSLNYSYNLRGWMDGINKTFVNTTGSNVNYFGQEINYDNGFTINQYDGNISGTKWKSKSNGIARAYGYSYDNNNRLTAADFSQQNTSGAAWTKDLMNFTVSNLNYDANGNIITLKQVGLVGAAIDTIDRLTYTYASGSNKLMAVSDTSHTANANLGDFINGTNSGNDYAYDGNGNLTVDQNRGSAITYNHLNLPATISIVGKGSISYQYDATGNRLKKTVIDSRVSPVKTTVTDYVNGLVYKQDTLQFIAHEEGRIRPVYKTGQAVSYSFDYFENDQLGNVRLVLTDQTDFTMYTATMETAVAATETALFSNIDETRTETPSGYPKDQDTARNASVAKLNAKSGSRKIGPSLVLRVMVGDTVRMHARAFYKSVGPNDQSTQHPAEEMIAGLLQAFGGHVTNDAHGSELSNNTPLNSSFYNGDYQRLKQREPDGTASNRPKAYLNFVLFDDQFKLVDENSGVRQVKATPDELQELGTDQMVAAKSGFLYVYTSNETEQDVFFDNVTVAVVSGPVLEETHYYPFGLAMTGISSNALKGMNYPENRKKFNGIEYTDDLDLDMYDAQLRNLDPQLGRWWQIDPKPSEITSPYAAMANNPLLYADPVGDTTWVFGASGQYLGVINDNLTNQVHFMENSDPNTPAFDASKLSLKAANKLGQAMRDVSIAFMGGNTAAQLKSISSRADKERKEIAFVGTIGDDKEIRITAMPMDKSNKVDRVDISGQIEKNYSKQEQSDLFLFGHVHDKAAGEPVLYPTAKENQLFLGEPTSYKGLFDYQPALYRSPNATSQGRSVALIATSYGVTVYGTGASAKTISGTLIVEDPVYANQPKSYLIYSNIKGK
ncbi:DUF6443 domain-containing protein [Chitinophaga sp. YR573]|uniref:DUF6443 domain-containing protein n=1 Tax=Chitinophaga sp. YR573 TaxID=1881040 RepID=UPI002100AACF|nr:DUF6443 domain-containing protein [Chitinophaga sp. YR573]